MCCKYIYEWDEKGQAWKQIHKELGYMEPCKNNYNFRFDYLIMLKFYSIILQIQFYKGAKPPVINHTYHCKLGIKDIFVVLIIFLVNFGF